MAEAGYILKTSFGIDHGELDGIPSHVCFVMGYEMCHVLMLVAEKPDQRLNFTINLSNKERIETAIRRSDRHVCWRVPSDDAGEQWVFLTVSAVGETEYEFLEDMRYEAAEE